MPEFFTVGNLTLDQIVLADGSYHSDICGGDCLYAAAAIRLWGHPVGIVSVVSERYPIGWLKEFESAGLDIRGVRRVPGQAHLGGTMIYRADGSREYLEIAPEGAIAESYRPVNLQRWYDFSPVHSDLPEDFLSSKAAHIAPMPVTRQAEFLAAISPALPRVTVDLPWWPEDQPNGELPRLAHGEAALVSEFELAGLFGDITPLEGARRLCALGAQITAVKLGAAGSLVYDGKRHCSWHIPVYPIDVVDPTGAGDAYCGGFLTGWVETDDPLQAALFATVSASFAIEHIGVAQLFQINRAESLRRLETMRKLSLNR